MRRIIAGFIRCASALAVIMLLLSGGGGCAESAIAAAGATAGFGLAQTQAEGFIRGELKACRMVPLAEARQAVIDAMNELGLEVNSDRMKEHTGYLRGQAEGGREIGVSLKADSPRMTRFEIRVGMMGDAAVSRLVMSRIDHALGINSPPEDERFP